MKKIKVDQNACIGCGACVAIDPEHFEFNDDGLSHPISQDKLDSETLIEAKESCPTSAISITECDDCDGDGEAQEEGECNCSNCCCDCKKED